MGNIILTWESDCDIDMRTIIQGFMETVEENGLRYAVIKSTDGGMHKLMVRREKESGQKE